MQVFEYGSTRSLDLESAQAKANWDLRKHLSDQTLEFVWEKNPFIDLTEIGVVYRGLYIHDCIRFTATIIERRCD